jgi:hypothetical protein
MNTINCVCLCEKFIPNDVAKYFELHFAATLALLKEQFKNGVIDLIEWCKEQNIKASSAPEPYRTADVNNSTPIKNDVV